MTHAALVMEHISKGFPGIQALDEASLTIRPGEIHGMVGENGAGKSTIIKVLAGIYRAESGTISVMGDPIGHVTPEAVHAAGIRFIHQELHLVPHFTVTESVFMGQEQSGPFGLKSREMRRRAESFLKDTLNISLSGGALIRDLGPAERKLVQIARALIDGQARIVVFDEPTAPLSSAEIAQLFEAIRALKARGIAMLYVSHYLKEITEICDRVTVFRNGRNVAHFDEITPQSGGDLVSAMVGRELGELYPERTDRTAAAAPALALRNAGDGAHFDDVSLELHAGEIVGIAGLVGSGRSAVVDTLYGLGKLAAGSMELAGKPMRFRSPAEAVAEGIVLVPRDRRNDGLVLSMTSAENINIASLEDIASFWLEDSGKARARAERQIADLDIRPVNPDAIARNLSGGNQQKLVLGRWLATNAKVFLLDEPTVGVDVGAKAEIYALIERLAAQGAAVLISSSDPAELIGTCDRILVMMRGRLAREIDASGLAVDALVALTTGANGDAA